MSLVICDVTPDEILFFCDSACLIENTDPLNYPKDTKKVMFSRNPDA